MRPDLRARGRVLPDDEALLDAVVRLGALLGQGQVLLLELGPGLGDRLAGEVGDGDDLALEQDLGEDDGAQEEQDEEEERNTGPR